MRIRARKAAACHADAIFFVPVHLRAARTEVEFRRISDAMPHEIINAEIF